ncbi:MAG TPA: hypothetical protein VIV60_14605, partial [Polyangiaceae bacterium]
MAIQLTVAGQRLEAEALVGSGATSVVWRCKRLELGDYCALKVARRDEDQSILVEEAERLLWGMSPWLPQLYGVGRLSTPLGEGCGERAACLLLEWLDGTTLRDSDVLGRLDDNGRLVVARDLGSALSDLHAAGLAHGDIKPENVILVGAPRDTLPVPAQAIRAWLLDLGLACVADNPVPRGGTRRYLAPEVMLAGSAGDGRTRDLWALGLLLAELVDPNWLAYPAPEMAERARGLGALSAIVAPLLALSPGARPPASWVQLQAAARVGQSMGVSQLLAARRARVRRAYLNARRQELVAAARSRASSVLVGGTAGEWIEAILPMLRSLDSLRGVQRRDVTVELADLSPSVRLKFIVDLIGSVAASWTIDATLGDAELIERILGAVEQAEPNALTARALTQPQHGEVVPETLSPIELSLLLVQGPPRQAILDASEAYVATAPVPLAFRLALGQKLRLVGELGRSLSVLDGSSEPMALAEAAETARRAGDRDGAMRRIRRLDDSLHELARSRAAATEARILLDSGAAEASLERLRNLPDTAPLLEARALSQIQLEQHRAASETLERARTLASSDEEQARVAATLGMLMHATADAPSAVRMFHRAVEYAARSGALLEEATYLTGLAAAAVDSSRLDDAIVAAERATALFEVLNQPHRAARAALNRVAAYAAVGAAVSARAAAQVAFALLRVTKDERCAANVHLALVDAC